MSEEIINYIIEEEEIDPRFIDVKLIQLLYENNFEKYFELTRLKYLSEKHREEIIKYFDKIKDNTKYLEQEATYLEQEATINSKEAEDINYKNILRNHFKYNFCHSFSASLIFS